ncbi:MAG: hypothetical protein JWQ97_2561 [Phenylobacterium sp.]|nr:hypothetical protein [Phenylobacterium sp.]
MRALSLHHLVAPDISAAELVRVAAELGCRQVCLFTQDPNAGLTFPVVADDELPHLRQVMESCGVTAYGVASFGLTPEVDVTAYGPALERGASLGASRANVRILDADESRATDNFAAFAQLCASRGIEAGIEFMGFGASDAFPQALRILQSAGCGKIALDALHVVRTGTPLAALQRLDPGLIGYVQLCDGPLAATPADYAREGAFDRLPPGEGEFPLRELLALVPADFPVSLEAPSERWRAQGLSAHERARRVVDATRRLLAEAQA